MGGEAIARALRRRRDLQNLKDGGLLDLVEIREGDALETLSVDLHDTIDMLLLDGAKSLYPEILALVERRLRPGALVIADNADYCPEYLQHIRSPVGCLTICHPRAARVRIARLFNAPGNGPRRMRTRSRAVSASSSGTLRGCMVDVCEEL